MQPISTYINNPEFLTAEVVEELSSLVERNPSYQAARILLLQGLYQLQDARFGATLREAALFIPDRATLFHLFEEARMSNKMLHPRTSTQIAKSSSADRTQTLIESFLEQRPEQQHPSHPVDASVDYMAYLMQQPDALPDALPDMETSDDDVFDNDDAPRHDVPDTQQNAATSGSDPYFTETLAHIYIKQGKYSKAIEIIRRLSLNVPEKNRYFADQIRFLEKLILNERALTSENK